MFAAHHALLDGLSARLFHQQLLAALNHSYVSSSPSFPFLAFPDPPALPAGQDDAIRFTNTMSYLAKSLWCHYAPSFLRPSTAPTPASLPSWPLKPIDFTLPYRTRVLPVDLPVPLVASLVAACSVQATTLTGLLHALAFVSLSRRLPARALAAATPISLRPFVVGPESEPPLLRCLLTTSTHAFSCTKPRAARHHRRGSDDNDGLGRLIWTTARRIRHELATLPADDVAGLLPYISDWHA